MKSILFFVLSAFLLSVGKPPILNTAKPKRGIYRNFSEFLNNSPSIQSPFNVVCRSADYKVERGTADYRLVLMDSMTRRRDLKKFWGVSDGEFIYINEVNSSGHLNFKKLQVLGRYCYFKGSVPNTHAAVTTGVAGLAGGALAAVAHEIDGDYPYIININNGKVFLLDRELLRTILKRDPELLADYEEEARRSKKNTLLSYIDRYNERHEDEITYNRPQPVDVVLYRRGKKERPEGMKLAVADSINVTLLPGTFQKITSMGDSLDVCMGEDCRTFSLIKRKTNYIECSWRSAERELKQVEERVGEYYLKEIMYSEGKGTGK